jgi:hypothetical protein
MPLVFGAGVEKGSQSISDNKSLPPTLGWPSGRIQLSKKAWSNCLNITKGLREVVKELLEVLLMHFRFELAYLGSN